MITSRGAKVWAALLLALFAKQLQAQQILRWRTVVPPLSQIDWIEPDPVDSEIVYAAASEGQSTQSGAFRSTDRGFTWTLLSIPILGDAVAKIQVDPRNRSLFATTCRTQNEGTFTRIYVSADGGASWDFEGDFAGECGPTFTFDTLRPDTVYFVLLGTLYVSEDSGRTWKSRGPGFGQLQSGPMGLLYAVDDDRIVRSADGGFTWSFFAFPPSACPNITAFAVQPTPPEILLVGTGMFSFHNLDCGGLFWSADGGRFWNEALFQVPASDFVADPEVPSRIYACSPAYSFGFFGAIGGVFESVDNGVHWQSLGVPSGGASSIALSADGQTLYALSGGIVYALPLDLTRVPPHSRETRILPPR